MSLDEQQDQEPRAHHVGGPPDVARGRLAPGTAAATRRDFLMLAGFTFAGTALSGCAPSAVHYAVAPAVQPDELVPGRSYEYASTCAACPAACGLLVKVRDGRPIKLEGNPQHPLSLGGLCAPGQASLLGLYDRLRLRQPLHDGKPSDWHVVDENVRDRLDDIRKRGQAVRFLTGSLAGPTARGQFEQFLNMFADARHVVYNARSCSAILDAHAQTHGVRLLPHYQLEKAEVIVSFGADFLGTWLSPVEFTAAYQAARRLSDSTPRSSYHVQFESCMSLTGSKADRRLCVAPGEVALAMSHLATRLAEKAGAAIQSRELEPPPVSESFLDQLAERLWQSRGRSVVLCGSHDVQEQVLGNLLNHLLDNYGSTVDIERPSHQWQGNDAELAKLLREIQEGNVAALFISQCNPVHDLPDGEALADALRRVPLVVHCAERLDETAALARYVCPVPHYLESWSDAEPVSGLVSLAQPTIAPLANTRSLLESLAAWMGKPQKADELLRAHWEQHVFPRWRGGGTFQDFWEHTLHDGFAHVAPQLDQPAPTAPRSFDMDAVRLVPRAGRPAEGTFRLVLYSKVGLPDASHAYNPWLHELPDPVSKITWDNYACLSPSTAAGLGMTSGDVVRLEVPTADGRPTVLELPVLVQPGQHDGVVAVALGYGSRLSHRFAKIGPEWLQARPTVGADGLVGKNAAAMLTWVEGNLRSLREGVRLTKTGETHALASSQDYDLLAVPEHLALAGQERRPIVRETTLAAYRRQLTQATTQPAAEAATAPPSAEANEDLWPADHPTTGAKWGMVIDMNACTGCSACVIACQAENNIPVVGKDEVRRHREMHWLRIDRYYSEREGGVDVAFQPMLCQHCASAPCEAVCPVLATVHSDEGLNQQVYNRCVGTRFCANNCPYKVRRFNWFNYAHDDNLQNLVLNPDVTVRSRGVMEKCTFCVQRIEEAKIEARRLGQPLRDGDVKTACQQSCSAHAIVFGDLNDAASRVARLAAGPRSYRVLEELNVRPSVSYLAVIRNRSASDEEPRNG
ncbi:MAG TPA: 4Fe-4S dicluster domain-containing protein [Pirellulales bacterium]|nr:4Fe-4S dicluster domain-containing protein [Pirellulales bacterium]